MRSRHKHAASKTKPKVGSNKAQEHRRNARKMALYCGGTTVVLLGLACMWVHHAISKSVPVRIPLVLVVFWMVCLGLTAWYVYEWRRR
jgi:hypothetical protein